MPAQMIYTPGTWTSPNNPWVEFWSIRSGLGWRSFQGCHTIWWPYPITRILSFPSKTNLGLPLWMPAGLCALIAAATWLANRRRIQRRRLGLCVQCGYDLRGSAETCPECGMARDHHSPPVIEGH
jgi:hypothetical protein